MAVRDRYRELPTFDTREIQMMGRDALLVNGSIENDRVKWADELQRLTSTDVAAGNRTAAAALLIRGSGASAWALTYGMGFQMLDPAYIDAGFGQRIAIRTADPSSLHSLTRTTLDYRARVDRLSIPGGEHLRGFGVGDFGEVVSRLVGKAEIPSVTGGGNRITIRGSDALSVPVGRSPESLLADLDALDALLAQDPVEGLEILEQLRAIKRGEPILARLDEQLAEAVSSPESRRIGLAWPHESVDENGVPNSYRFFNAGREFSRPREDTPTLKEIIEAAIGDTHEETLGRLRRVKIQLFRDTGAEPGEAISTQVSAQKWLAFECDFDSRRYCLHDGRWFEMDTDYAAAVQANVKTIFDGGPGVVLPDWPGDIDEAKYNALVASSIGGVCLDRKLAHTKMHPRGIELCDVLASDGTLIHIKHLTSSAPASHLLAQALVSVEALLHDVEAREELVRRVRNADGDPQAVPVRPSRVVLGVARESKIAADSLFTFTQVSLVRNVSSLQARGVDVFVSPIAIQ